MSKAITDLMWKILPYVVVAAIISGAIWFYHVQLQNRYDEGYNAGISYQKGEQAKADETETQRREGEKSDIERSAISRAEAAIADRANAIASFDRVRSELDRIRELASNYTGPQSTSTSTRQVVVMLTDMLTTSNEAYRRTAEEADNYYNAGLICQNQYLSLRGEYDKAKSGKAYVENSN